MTEPVVNIHSMEGYSRDPEGSTRFGATIAMVGQRLELGGLGCNFVTVDPGKRAFPAHNHLGNDELFVILEGEGTYRFGNAEYKVAAGYCCAAPRGGPEKAHQLINTGTSPLKYLAISTKQDPDVIEYPDSGKFAAVAVSPGANFMSAHLKFVGRKDSAVDYFDGEQMT
ncbi:MAG: cupin domain-containing protein [Albidovulum sp.]|nr:cupin domain-containing protein [Albidovulum sp.]